MPRLLTLYGLSRELGLSVDSLRRWIAEGVIPAPGLGAYRAEVFTEEQVRDIRRIVARRYIARPSFAHPARRADGRAGTDRSRSPAAPAAGRPS